MRIKDEGRNEAVISSAVKDVFSKGFVSAREDDTLSSCLSFFKEEMPPVLVVLDSEGKYKGVLARRWIIRSRLDPSTTKVETLMRPAPRSKNVFCYFNNDYQANAVTNCQQLRENLE